MSRGIILEKEKSMEETWENPDELEISAGELDAALKGGAALYDLRGEFSREYGFIPGSAGRTEEQVRQMLDAGELAGRKIVLYCARGEVSLDLAAELRESGIAARSLAGGYIEWLRQKMEREQAAAAAGELQNKVENSLRKKFHEKIWSNFTKAVKDYQLVKPGDKIAVCISGGKDSMLLAKLMQELHRHTCVPFEVEFLVMDPGYSPQNRRVIEENLKNLGLDAHIFESDIFSSVYHVEKSPCYLCARMRRGHLYNEAKSLGCNKIALGHHYDDVIETILMGMLWGAQVQTMMPKLHSTNFPGMELIRPLYLIREDDIKAWRDYNGLHFIQCACKFTDSCTTCRGEGNQETRSKRAEVKELIRTMKKTNPDVEQHIFRSVENVCLDTVIAYKQGGKKISFLDGYDGDNPSVTP